MGANDGLDELAAVLPEPTNHEGAESVPTGIASGRCDCDVRWLQVEVRP